MKKIILTMFALVVTSAAFAFNPFGHQTIAALANKYLNDKAKSEVKAILGTDMVKEATWLNTIRKTQPETKSWHFFVLAENGKSVTTNENDGIVVLEKNIEVLRNRKAHTADEVKTALRIVIHLVGDIHCISHIHIDGVEASKGFQFMHWNELEGKGYKAWKAQWYTYWNNTFCNRHNFFSPEYYGDDIDIYANAKKAEYEKGTPRFWAENTGEDVVRALEFFSPGAVVPTQILQLHEFNHTKCMAKASYRLAALLNELFK
jgi:hypothetical protein